jgi:hypothetical protein
MTTPDAKSAAVILADDDASVGPPLAPSLTPKEQRLAAKTSHQNIRVSPEVLLAARKDGEALLRDLHTSLAGLSEAEAEERAHATGPNERALPFPAVSTTYSSDKRCARCSRSVASSSTNRRRGLGAFGPAIPCSGIAFAHLRRREPDVTIRFWPSGCMCQERAERLDLWARNTGLKRPRRPFGKPIKDDYVSR